MADRYDDLKKEVEDLKEVVAYQAILLNKLIVLVNLADTDLKNHLHLLD